MNLQQQQQAGGINTWHAQYSITDRQKVVQILTLTLKECQPSTYDAQKASQMAQDFERYTFQKAQTRDDYLLNIKQKIAQFKATAARNGASLPQTNMNAMRLQPPQNMNAQSMNFLQQQAHARQQSAAQIQAQLRNKNQQQQQQQQQPTQPMQYQPSPQSVPAGQPLAQQQMQRIGAQIRNIPIPQALLSRIPNLPPNVNTLSQIIECIQKGVIPNSVTPLIKDIHNTHMQIVLRQQQQQQQQNFNPLQPQQQQGVNQSLAPGAMTAQQKLQFQRQLQQQQQQQRGGAAGGASQFPQAQQHRQQPQQHAMNPQMRTQQYAPQRHPQGAEVPEFTILLEDFMTYSADALALLARLQAAGSIQPNLDARQKESFIRKFIIHQKTQAWKQQNGQAPNNAPRAPPQRPLGPGVNGMMGLEPQQTQPLPQLLPILNQDISIQGQPLNNGLNGLGPPAPAPYKTALPVIPFRNANGMIPDHLQQQQGHNQSYKQPVAPGVNVAQPSMRPSGAQAALPPVTDDMRIKLKQLVEEVSRNHVALRDVTMLLSPNDKNSVRESMMRISQQYSSVDSIITYFYVTTRNVDGTKKLIQMKYMTKNIMENLQRGVYLATPELLEKLRTQYQKYFEYVKDQISNRRMQIQQQQQSQQMSPTNPPMAPTQAQPLQQFANLQQPTVPQQQQRGRQLHPQQQHILQQQQQMNLNGWPGVNRAQQLPKGAMQNSPMMPTGTSPMVNNAHLALQQPSSANKVSPQRQNARNVANRSAANTPMATNGANKKFNTGGVGVAGATGAAASRRKSSKSNAAAVTPGANAATTPGSSANAIKTPSSMPTPMVFTSQGSKNTPIESPQNHNKNLAKQTSGTVGHSQAQLQQQLQHELHAMLYDEAPDAQSLARKELASTNAEKFFLAALANVLDLNDSNKSLPTPSSIHNGKGAAMAPSSPLVALPTGWTCEIKREALTSTLQQVAKIKMVAEFDVIEACTRATESKFKRTIEHDEDEWEKKHRPEVSDADRLFYQPAEFDEWREFMLADA